MGRELREPVVDVALCRWIGRRGGVVARTELRRRGIPDTTIDSWVRSGRLVVVHRGVYGLGYAPLTFEGRCRAAVLACGDSAVCSHYAAAALHAMVDLWRIELIDVSRPASGRHQDGVAVHRSMVPSRHVVERRFVPVTNLARTIVDWADIAPYGEVRDGVDRLRAFPAAALRRTASELTGRRGARTVAQLLERDEAHTKSEMERQYLRFLRRTGLPRPDALNVRVGGCKVDALYRDARLAVELDGRAYHARRGQMRVDRRRDDRIQLAGHRPFRLLWEEIAFPEEWAETAARQQALMGLGAVGIGGRP